MSQQNNPQQDERLQQELEAIDKIEKESHGHYLPAEEISMFCEQVSLVLSSGVPLYDGIEALCENYKDTSHYEAFAVIFEGVKENGSLYEALKGVHSFPPYMVEMVRIGETTGKLDHVMTKLSHYYLRESKIQRSIQSAVVYPLSLLVMMAAVIMILVVKVLPIFDQVYRSLGTEMNETSIALMNAGSTIGNVVLILVAVLVVVVIVIVILMKTGLRQKVLDFVGKIFPPVRRITQCIVASRFASNMSMMLGSGYPLEEALPLIAVVLDDPIGEAKVHDCYERVKGGEPFPLAIANVKIFDKLHNKMIQMGFLSGKTDSVMARLAYMYEEEVDHNITRVVAMIEPAMVAMLSIIIGAILLSVMMPMVSIMSSIL